MAFRNSRLTIRQRLRLIIRDLMVPEAQANGHHWTSTALSHCWIGMGIWGGFAVIFDRWTAVWLAPLAYLLIIEGAQMMRVEHVTRFHLWDAALDTTAVAFGCIAGAYVRDGAMIPAMAAWMASLVPVLAGWLVRARGAI